MKKLFVLIAFAALAGMFFITCQRDSNPFEATSLSEGFSEGPQLSGAKKPVDYVKKLAKGQYYLVSKDPVTWAILPKPHNPWADAKFDIDGNMLTMRIKAHGLTPGDWYFVELVDKSSGWNAIDKTFPSAVGDADSYSQFYGQANHGGKVDISFSWDITGHDDIEVNLKNADWVALLEPSEYGLPIEWINTGQGWGYVLYGAITIPTEYVPPVDYDKKVAKGQYHLVALSSYPDGEILPKPHNPWAKAKFDIDEGNILTMRIKAHGLVPGDWYFVELVDTSPEWHAIDKHFPSQEGDADSYSRFYGQADRRGNVKINFSWDITGGPDCRLGDIHDDIEVNMKNAPIRALGSPSTYGDMNQWEVTGQGDFTDSQDWYYVL